MPWKEITKMASKQEFVQLALKKESSFSELCQRFKISRKTGYKLINRFQLEGIAGLEEKARIPRISPNKTCSSIEEQVIQLRHQKPYWGARKIRAFLVEKNIKKVPAKSTVHDILNRNHLILEEDSLHCAKTHRFEHEDPNDLWQVDFKGMVQMHQGSCHPLTLLDDHSRYAIGVKACSNERSETVKEHFIRVFEEHGLPWRMNFDNGPPWGSSHANRCYKYTELSTWLIRLGINISFSTPYHPQTNGKVERFHRTLKLELLRYYTFKNLQEAQHRFDLWRDEYNLERPHEAIGMKTPLSRYRPSTRQYSNTLSEIEYYPEDIIRKVNNKGMVSYRGKPIFLSESLKGLPVAFRQTGDKITIYFCNQKLLSFQDD